MTKTEGSNVEKREGLLALEELHRWDLACILSIRGFSNARIGIDTPLMILQKIHAAIFAVVNNADVPTRWSLRMNVGFDVRKVPLIDDARWPVSITVRNLVIFEDGNETVQRRFRHDFGECRERVLGVLNDISMESCQVMYSMNFDHPVSTTATPTRHT